MASSCRKRLKDSPSGILAKRMIAPGLLFLVGLFLLWETSNIPVDNTSENLNPAFWPRICVVGLLLGALIRSFEIFMTWDHAMKGKHVTIKENPFSPLETDPYKVGVAMGLCLMAVVMMDLLGFALANFVFLSIFFSFYGMRSKWKAILASIFCSVLLLYIFGKIAYIPFPKGVWIFHGITIGLYRLLHIF